ncbi:RimK family alpha-L-glutamate ligase (plasmid) [Pseudalkalibacillus hwajinpoensis]|uniref:RimK family alpha-L-glutamate ligase n=1 Tax=Guptibacillus hwajinpoensis TaxID=208199 RepID=UPI00325B7E7E
MSNKPKMDILLCVTKLRTEEKMIIRELNLRNISVKVILDSMSLPLDEIFKGRYQLAIVRCLSQKEGLKRAQILDKCGLKTINDYNAITICTNKILQSILFDRHQIPQPNYCIAFNPDNLKTVSNQLGGQFIIKPPSSSWGRGISLIENVCSLEAWIAARESVDIRNQEFPVLTQEKINKGNFDIRVVIVGTTPLVAFKRVSNETWRTNTHLGASVIPVELNQEIQELANKVTTLLGEGLYGLDLLYDFDKEKYLVCEVNQNPEFSNSWEIHKVDISSYIAEFVSKRITNDQEVSYG